VFLRYAVVRRFLVSQRKRRNPEERKKMQMKRILCSLLIFPCLCFAQDFAPLNYYNYFLVFSISPEFEESIREGAEIFKRIYRRTRRNGFNYFIKNIVNINNILCARRKSSLPSCNFSSIYNQFGPGKNLQALQTDRKFYLFPCKHGNTPSILKQQ
jgi:hypothetical protein